MKTLSNLAFVLLLATATMAQQAATLDYDNIFKWVSGKTSQTVIAGNEIESIAYNCPIDMQVIELTPNIVESLKIGYIKEDQTCIIYGEVDPEVKSGTYSQTLTLTIKGPNDEPVTYTAKSSITVEGLPMTAKIVSGNNKQVLRPGEPMQDVVFKYTNVESVTPRKQTVPNGIDISCIVDNSNITLCTASGTIQDQTPQNYEIILDVTSNIVDGYQYTAESHIWINVVTEKVILRSTSADRTVTAGEEMDPIVYHSAVTLVDGYMRNAPSGLSFVYNPNTSEITIQGTPDEKLRDSVYNYELELITSESETIKKTGTITVNHKKGTTKLTIVENGVQDVFAGDSIKPVVLKYQYMLKQSADKALGSYSIKADEKTSTITIIGTAPNIRKDTTIFIKVVAEGELNNDTVEVQLNVKRKKATTTIEVISGNASQTVAAGDSIKPIIFDEQNADSIKAIGKAPGNVTLTRDENGQIVLFGAAKENATSGEYKILIVAYGIDNNDTAVVTLTVPQTFRPIVFDIAEGSLNQTVKAGDSITPMVFRFDNIKNISLSGFPKGIERSLNNDSKELKIYGAIDSSMSSHKYDFSIEITGVDEDSTITGSITVKALETASSSSTATESSSSEIKSSSSSSKTNSSSSIKTESSSSSKAKSSSSTKASSSSTKTENKSSSSQAKSSSSKKSEPKSSSSRNKEKSSSSSEDTRVLAKIINTMSISLEGRTLLISGGKQANVDILDMQGRSIASFKQVKNAVTLENIHQGCYIVRVHSGSNSLIRRIAIK